MVDKKCTVCNIKIDKDNYKKIEIYVRTVITSIGKNIITKHSLEMMLTL